MARPERSLDVRSLKGLSVTKTIPADELLMKPLIERPGKATALSTPFSLSAMVDISVKYSFSNWVICSGWSRSVVAVKSLMSEKKIVNFFRSVLIVTSF